MASVDELAANFWRRVGPAPSYPRDLEGPILWGLPLAVVKLPRLRSAAVDEWFRLRGGDHGIGGLDRRLRACLFAIAGRGVIFLDATDPAPERRFSLAHEAGHFVADYLVPRERVLGRLGASYEDVIDGRRPPVADERIASVLAGVTLGVHRHLMDRDPVSEFRVAQSESRADRLALELLAPRTVVIRSVRHLAEGTSEDVEAVLIHTFGLPAEVARGYARFFVPRTAPSLRDWLGRDVEVPGRGRNTMGKE